MKQKILISLTAKVASSTITPVAKEAAENLNLGENGSLSDMADQVKELVSNAAKKTANQAKNSDEQDSDASDNQSDKLVETVTNFVSNTDDDATQKLRDEAITQITENTKVSRAEAEKLLTKWQVAYQKVDDKAKEKADEVKEKAKAATVYGSNVLSAVTFSAVIAMILGAIATVWGSALGVKYIKE